MTDQTTPSSSYRPQSGWTQNAAITETVHAMWNDGRTAKQIAFDIGGEYRVTLTRNMVLGYIHRRGWQLERPEEVRRKANAHVHRPRKGPRRPTPPAPWSPAVRKTEPTAPALPDTATQIDPGCQTPLLELREGQCRWPSGDDARAMLFCGAPVMGDKCSWCAYHFRKATEGSRPRRAAGFYISRFN